MSIRKKHPEPTEFDRSEEKVAPSTVARGRITPSARHIRGNNVL
jgi:hypothetical protein